MAGPGRAEIALALHPLAAESARGVSASIDLGDGSAYSAGCGQRSLAYLDLDVTAVSGMSGVEAAGTSPPTVTLNGTPALAVDLVVECLVGGARGTWSGQYSIDGGATFTPFTSAASIAIGATGVTMAIAAGPASTDNVWTSSTPTLSIALETSRDGTFWHAAPVGAFDVVAVAGWQRRAFLDLDRFVRARWTLSVGAEISFALSGAGLLVYAGLSQMSSLAVRSAALVELSTEEKADAIIAGSDMADQKIGKRYQLPLVGWGMSVSKHTASVCALTMMQARGYAPEPGQRDTFKDGYDLAMKYFEDVFVSGDPSIVDQKPSDDFNTNIPDPRPRNWHRGWVTR